ncbi:hypothetical protein PPERSA_04872 [Pseudocohnilembus persalinus]|uniref:PB1 domain-containing protein n=1 Tax=Pseudocohnilembus persalinus TaxID=266149 RepID=A0A0V0QJK3_PSEPJ|nr:hypothetical protein PPERSA_04872 [Pseudocohnilembus persalinus]|eukprot:KRX02250.1 hypothetical protein PPERSA_04872 [Pseudocohnilembus persalinus]
MIKIQFRKQVHFYDQNLELEPIKKYIKETFQNLPVNYQIGYYDEEGDRISISNPQDFKIYLNQQQQEPKQKLVIFDLETTSDEEQRYGYIRGCKLTEQQKEEFRKKHQELKARKKELKKKRKEEQTKMFEEKKARFFEKVQSDQKLSKIMIKLQSKIKEAIPKMQEFLERDLSYKEPQKKQEKPVQKQSEREVPEHFPILKYLGIKKICKYVCKQSIIPYPFPGKKYPYYLHHHEEQENIEQDIPFCLLEYSECPCKPIEETPEQIRYEPQDLGLEYLPSYLQTQPQPQTQPQYRPHHKHHHHHHDHHHRDREREYNPIQYPQQEKERDYRDYRDYGVFNPQRRIVHSRSPSCERKMRRSRSPQPKDWTQYDNTCGMFYPYLQKWQKGRKGRKNRKMRRQMLKRSPDTSSSESLERSLSHSSDNFEKIHQQQQQQQQEKKLGVKQGHHHHHHHKRHQKRGHQEREYFGQGGPQQFVNNMINAFRSFGIDNRVNKQQEMISKQKAAQMQEVLGGEPRKYYVFIDENPDMETAELISLYLEQQQKQHE